MSVTAEQWLPMEAVTEEQLPAYLGRLKQAGYRLVGVEQTAASVSLLDADFADRTALLLGREKEGIPVHLIDRLDQCIEIPQLGVTRCVRLGAARHAVPCRRPSGLRALAPRERGRFPPAPSTST